MSDIEIPDIGAMKQYAINMTAAENLLAEAQAGLNSYPAKWPGELLDEANTRIVAAKTVLRMFKALDNGTFYRHERAETRLLELRQKAAKAKREKRGKGFNLQVECMA